jgi:hypothetical protein
MTSGITPTTLQLVANGNESAETSVQVRYGYNKRFEVCVAVRSDKVVFNIYHVVAQVVNWLEEPAAFNFYPEDRGRSLLPLLVNIYKTT